MAAIQMGVAVHQNLQEQKRFRNSFFLKRKMEKLVIVAKKHKNKPTSRSLSGVFIWQEQLKSWEELSRLSEARNL